MAEFPDIPAIEHPSSVSVFVFFSVILLLLAWFIVSVYRSGGSTGIEKRRRAAWFSVGLFVWLAIGAAAPLSGLLHLKMLPPPGFIFAFVCLATGVAFAFSKTGNRLTSLPTYWLVGIHAFRLPLELVLHNWFESATIPVQMTYEGYNFDIVTGILALAVSAWIKFGSPPKVMVWIFNIVGLALLLSVIAIAIVSVPTPLRQFTNEPPLLLPFYFPYSYILSVAVTGALVVHLILFRKLFSPHSS